MIMGIAAVLVGMLALNAGPAMADESDGFFADEHFSGNDVFFVDEGTMLDELCSPGLSDGIFIPGCIFSDSIEEDINFDDEEVVFFLEEDIDFDFEDEDEDIFDDDHDNHDNEREALRIIDRD
jgi:hypothetical protein